MEVEEFGKSRSHDLARHDRASPDVNRPTE